MDHLSILKKFVLLILILVVGVFVNSGLVFMYRLVTYSRRTKFFVTILANILKVLSILYFWGSVSSVK
jgi:hypothetical protein